MDRHCSDMVRGERMSDLIRRQDAIDRINKQRKHLHPESDSRDYIGDCAYRICVEILDVLPSAEPEPIKLRVDHDLTEEEIKNLKQKIADSPIVLIPSAQRRGKWERHYSRPNVYADLCWHCSNCSYKANNTWANKWHFCPNCGAKMEDNDG